MTMIKCIKCLSSQGPPNNSFIFLLVDRLSSSGRNSSRMSEVSVEPIIKRIRQLYTLVSSGGLEAGQHGALLGQEGLLDALLVLYEECTKDYLKREENITTFVNKCGFSCTCLFCLCLSISSFFCSLSSVFLLLGYLFVFTCFLIAYELLCICL